MAMLNLYNPLSKVYISVEDTEMNRAHYACHGWDLAEAIEIEDEILDAEVLDADVSEDIAMDIPDANVRIVKPTPALKSMK